MSTLCKRYITNGKSFFPVIGKQEKNYLRNLELNVEDYCAESAVSSLEELYQSFGTPTEVINSYYSAVKTEHIIKQVKKAHAIKALFLTMVISVLIATSTICFITYSKYQAFKEQLIFSEEYVIE